MKFIELIKDLKEGKKVTCNDFSKNCMIDYLYVKNNKLLGSDGEERTWFTFLTDDDTSWKVVDEDKDWNLAEHWKEFSNKTIYNVAVKKCRDLIIKDIRNYKNNFYDDVETQVISTINKRFGDL